MPADFDHLSFDAPFVLQEGGVRSLHFTHGEIQSSMCVERPDELQLDYTRTMMGFLLLAPRPRRIVMIGLGGGSLAKFCHRFLPAACTTVVENNPAVIALRAQFAIPADDSRFRVVLHDGAQFVAGLDGAVDVLLVDGFGASGQPPQLCSQRFYDDCWRALAPGGVLVVNLHADDVDHPRCAERIGGSFGGNAMQVLALEQGNCVVFAGRDRRVTLQALRSVDGADALDPQVQRQLRGEFAHIGWSARALTPPRSGPGGG